MTRTHFLLATLFALLLLAIAWHLGVHLPHLDGPALLGVAAPAAHRPFVRWGRKREQMKPFTNVAVSSTATSILPRYPRTILGLMLQRGGTAFLYSDISRIEVFLGTKSIWGPVSGQELRDVARYISGDRQQANDDHYFEFLDFTNPNVKEIAGEQIGGLDLTTLPSGEVRMEVDIGAGANAPTLIGHVIWGGPQGGGKFGTLMHKLRKRTYPQFASGDQYPAVDVRGAILLRQFWRYTVANAAVSSACGLSEGANTGNGVMGAITVTARTPTGRYKLKIVSAASNAGNFILTGPNGKIVGTGAVATAFSANGLAFTLADGGTDFIAGDGFNIDVLPLNTDGNLNLVEIKKNDDVWWSRSCRAARVEEVKYGRSPLSQMYVADFLLDNHIDSIMDTADATALDYHVNITSADTLTVIHQVLGDPLQV